MCCDFCQEWFHPACVGVDEDEAEAVARWHCPGCIDLMSENPVMSKKRYPNFYIIDSMEQFLSLLWAEPRGAAGGGGGKIVREYSHWGSSWIFFLFFFNLVSGECMLSHFYLV